MTLTFRPAGAGALQTACDRYIVSLHARTISGTHLASAYRRNGTPIPERLGLIEAATEASAAAQAQERCQRHASAREARAASVSPPNLERSPP